MNTERDEGGISTYLADTHKEYTKGMTGPILPVVFIIGVARSGTTLVSQMLNVSNQFSCISNITAKFPYMPAFGMKISEMLKPLEDRTSAPYNNSYGQTDGLWGPHEFGYFWNRWFDLGQDTHNLTRQELAKVDTVGLLSELAAMESAGNKPLAFKNNTWISLQAAFIASILPLSVFVVCRRDPVFVAQSIVLGRENRHNDREQWWSMRPSTYQSLKDLSLWDQVAGQVIDLEHEMDNELSTISPKRIVEVNYDDLCLNPGRVFLNLCDAVTNQGVNIQSGFTPPKSFISTDTQRLADKDWALLKGAVEKKLAV